MQFEVLFLPIPLFVVHESNKENLLLQIVNLKIQEHSLMKEHRFYVYK